MASKTSKGRGQRSYKTERTQEKKKNEGKQKQEMWRVMSGMRMEIEGLKGMMREELRLQREQFREEILAMKRDVVQKRKFMEKISKTERNELDRQKRLQATMTKEFTENQQKVRQLIRQMEEQRIQISSLQAKIDTLVPQRAEPPEGTELHQTLRS